MFWRKKRTSLNPKEPLRANIDAKRTRKNLTVEKTTRDTAWRSIHQKTSGKNKKFLRAKKLPEFTVSLLFLGRAFELR